MQVVLEELTADLICVVDSDCSAAEEEEEEDAVAFPVSVVQLVVLRRHSQVEYRIVFQTSWFEFVGMGLDDT